MEAVIQKTHFGHEVFIKDLRCVKSDSFFLLMGAVEISNTDLSKSKPLPFFMPFVIAKARLTLFIEHNRSRSDL